MVVVVGKPATVLAVAWTLRVTSGSEAIVAGMGHPVLQLPLLLFPLCFLAPYPDSPAEAYEETWFGQPDSLVALACR